MFQRIRQSAAQPSQTAQTTAHSARRQPPQLRQSPTSAVPTPDLSPSPQFAYDLTNIPLFPPIAAPAGPIQTKLAIGQPGDRYEQEADRVAQQVVQHIQAPAPLHPPEIQRSEAEAEEEVIQRSPLLQCKSGPGSIPAMRTTAASIQQLRGCGQALPAHVQAPMQRAFGADFSAVRIHTDGQSDRLNRSLHAKAFTTRQDIFFRQGMYDPTSRSGRELIAHELTHVVQQNGGAVQRSQPINQPIAVGTSAPLGMIQAVQLNASTAPAFIISHRQTFLANKLTDFARSNSAVRVPVTKQPLLKATYDAILTTLKAGFRGAENSIVASPSSYADANLSVWGDSDNLSATEKDSFVEQFATTTYVAQLDLAKGNFTRDLNALHSLIPEIPRLYTEAQAALLTESAGETDSSKLKSKLEALQGQTEPTAMQTVVKTKLTGVMGEIDVLKAATVDAAAIITAIKTQPTTATNVLNEANAEQAIQAQIDQTPAVQTFRTNQAQIKEKTKLLAVFANEDVTNAGLQAGLEALPADQPEVHEYYFKHPNAVKDAFTATLWTTYREVALNLWNHYKANWLDALYKLSSGTRTIALTKLKNTAPIDWQQKLLTRVPPDSAGHLFTVLLEYGQARAKSDFLDRYEIQAIESDMNYREVAPTSYNDVLKPSTAPPVDRIGYVVNITTIPSDPSPRQIAEKYYNQGFDDPSQSKQRIAMVVGVNRVRSLANTSDAAVKKHARDHNFDQFSLVAFGFTWDFNWKKKAGSSLTDADGFDGALNAFKEQNDETQNQALKYESANIQIQDRLPYAQFKERVTAHPKTRDLVNLLSTYNRYVYIHLGDSDAVSLKAPEEQPTASVGEALKGELKRPGEAKPKSIFSRYDVALEQQGKPFMAIGGYEFRTQGTSGTAEEKKGKGDLDRTNLEHLLTYLANQLDQAVRIAIASVDAKAVYPTEPNLVFLAAGPGYNLFDPSLGLFTSDGALVEQGALYGKGAREGRKLQTNLLTAREKAGFTGAANKIVYDPRLGIATESDRFRLEGTAKADYYPDNPTYQERRKTAIHGITATKPRKEAFKSQIIEDIANQPQSFVTRSIGLEINAALTSKFRRDDRSRVQKFTNRISNKLAQKYAIPAKFKASRIERAAADEADARINTLEAIIGAVETTLDDPRLGWLWTEMNRVIDALYASGYTTD
jgi:hypothetical protein